MMYNNKIWPNYNKLEFNFNYPWLNKNENADVLIIGGGLSGAITAYNFSKSGINTVLISDSPIGMMGTSVSSGIIDYAIDNNIKSLSKILNKHNAIKYYNLCLESFLNIEDIVSDISMDIDYYKRNSILYTNNALIKNIIYDEYKLRKSNGFDVEYIEDDNSLGYKLKSGILSKNSCSEINPYLFSHSLLRKSIEMGARVYENTLAYKIYNVNNRVKTYVNTANKIYSKKVIMCVGTSEKNSYKNSKFNNLRFTLITKPIKYLNKYINKDIKYDLSDKFVFIRTINDNRVMISGLDTKLNNFDKNKFKLIDTKNIINDRYNELEFKLNQLFNNNCSFKVDLKYYSLVRNTEDKLPIIFENDDYPNIYFNYPTGYNGIVHSEFGSRLLLSLYKNEINKDIYMFHDNRNTL